MHCDQTAATGFDDMGIIGEESSFTVQIDNKIKDYLIFSGESVIEALRKINQNKSRIIFIVENNGFLIGSMSDGDFRRWITATENYDLNTVIDDVMNPNVVSLPVSADRSAIHEAFSPARDIIPLLDESQRFVALARKQGTSLSIGTFNIGTDDRTFIIAEIGNNHNGSLSRAKELVDRAVEAGADCAKFQMRDLGSLYSDDRSISDTSYDLSSQYTLDLLKRFQLGDDELLEVFDYCYEKKILPLCTPWDLKSLDRLEAYGMEGYKVASADFTNHELLHALARTGKPLICSTGMSSEAEIKQSIDLLRKHGSSFAVLHCNSTYPTPFKDVNLRYLLRLQKYFDGIVGYSGHERGTSIPVAAVSLGARIIEKHLTLDQSMEGNDHKASLLPEDFARMVRDIRNVEDALGQQSVRALTQGEMINRENLAKSLIINQPLKKGQSITKSMIEIKSPGLGLQPNRLQHLVGMIANRDFKSGDFFFESDLTEKRELRRRYRFNRPYGVPVRYHDYHKLTRNSSLDFVEFHLSYHDLNMQMERFFDGPQAVGFAVHCPELFANDHILDLASGNETYRQKSVEHLRAVIETVGLLAPYFPKTESPVLVVNAGGWNVNGFVAPKERAVLYERVEESLAQIDTSSVQIAIQTMPPFPWHFGGQSHHNLFVDPDEIAAFCRKSGHRICFDISHSTMACNFYSWSFADFAQTVLPHTIHLHVVDAIGVDGEGVQIGKGDVDFQVVKRVLAAHAPHVPFIPEVWQGHKNDGEGFWLALEFLEQVGL